MDNREGCPSAHGQPSRRITSTIEGPVGVQGRHLLEDLRRRRLLARLAVMGALPRLRIGRSSSKNLFDKGQCLPNFRPSRLPVDGTKARIFAPQFCERFFCFLREGLKVLTNDETY